MCVTVEKEVDLHPRRKGGGKEIRTTEDSTYLILQKTRYTEFPPFSAWRRYYSLSSVRSSFNWKRYVKSHKNQGEEESGNYEETPG